MLSTVLAQFFSLFLVLPQHYASQFKLIGPVQRGQSSGNGNFTCPADTEEEESTGPRRAEIEELQAHQDREQERGQKVPPKAFSNFKGC